MGSACVRFARRKGRRAHEEERERFWGALPRILGLKDWEVLEEMRSEAYGGDL